LIWNAVDADATTVTVTVETGDLGAIEAVVVVDDGTGRTPEDARKGFGALGGSWKASEKVSRDLPRATGHRAEVPDRGTASRRAAREGPPGPHPRRAPQAAGTAGCRRTLASTFAEEKATIDADAPGTSNRSF
jgi:hypothetical protein